MIGKEGKKGREDGLGREQRKRRGTEVRWERKGRGRDRRGIGTEDRSEEGRV